mgnify:FL=1
MADKRKTVKELIADAFAELVTEKPYLEITVTDVIKKADVSRASFYRNFSSTSDVLDYILDSITATIKKNVLPVISSQDERSWRAFLFRYIYYLVDNNLVNILIQALSMSVPLDRIVYWGRELSLELNPEIIDDKYSLAAKTGLINGVILHWLNGGQKESPEEIVDYLMKYIPLI